MLSGLKRSRLLLALTLIVCGCSTRAGPSARLAEATVLLDAGYAGSWPAGLDPATNTTARANLSMMNAIYGGLFQLVADENGENPRITGVLATGYELTDGGHTVIVHLREGVTFSDGTPFDAAAVRSNIERDLRSACTCSPTGWPWAKTDIVTTPDDHTVALHFDRPYGAVINAMPSSNINWIASPTALKEMGGEAFKMKPVGAGPFLVVSNQLSSMLVLERNPSYWQKGRPHLDKLVFRSIGGEQAAYQAVLAGDAQIFEGMTSTPLIEQAEKDSRLTVTRQPATSPYVIQLNTFTKPFDDPRAREAIYFATNVEAIRQGLFHNWYPASQSFTGPGGLFHHPEVPGYRGYDPAKARSIVAELGGIKITLGTVRSFVAEQVITALQSQWRDAGIDVSIESYELATLIQRFRSGQWTAMLQASGSYDPEAGAGLAFRFHSDAPYTGVSDRDLDQILEKAAGTVDPHVRDALYFDAAKHISDKAYAPFLFAFAPTQLAARGVRGPGLTTKIPPILVNTGIIWQDVEIAAK